MRPRAHPHKGVQADGHPVGQQLLYHCFCPEKEHQVGHRTVVQNRGKFGGKDHSLWKKGTLSHNTEWRGIKKPFKTSTVNAFYIAYWKHLSA